MYGSGLRSLHCNLAEDAGYAVALVWDLEQRTE